MKWLPLFALAVGCITNTPPDGAITCSAEEHACPRGYFCNTDDTCWQDGHSPDAAVSLDGGGDAAPKADLAFSEGFLRKVTVSRYKVGVIGDGVNKLVSYPVPVELSDPSIKPLSESGHMASATAADLRFSSDDNTTCAGSPPCLLDFDIERYVDGYLLAWVRVPGLRTVNAGTDTTFDMTYGEAARVKSEADVVKTQQQTWDAAFRGVWHFAGAGGNKIDESTAGQHVGVATSVAVSGGRFGMGLSFGMATQSRIDIPADAALDFDTGKDWTMSMWVHSSQPDLSTSRPALIFKKDTNAGQGYEITASSGTPKWYGAFASGGAPPVATVYGGSVTDGAWHLVTYVRGGTSLRAYHDGVLVDAQMATAKTTINKRPLHLGAREMSDSTFGDFYVGDADEARISSAARPASWITTDFAFGKYRPAIGPEFTP